MTATVPYAAPMHALIGLDRGAMFDLLHKYNTAALSALSFQGAEIAGRTSWRTLVVLVERYGGGERFIPATGQSQLRPMIGAAHVRALSAFAGGGALKIPARTAMLRLLRDIVTVELLASGRPMRQIARQLGVHERTISRKRANLAWLKPDAPATPCRAHASREARP